MDIKEHKNITRFPSKSAIIKNTSVKPENIKVFILSFPLKYVTKYTDIIIEKSMTDLYPYSFP